jgi:hypothetical protein
MMQVFILRRGDERPSGRSKQQSECWALAARRAQLLCGQCARTLASPAVTQLMDFELRSTPAADSWDEPRTSSSTAEFEISAAPLIADQASAADESEAPRANSAPILCLMARDPHTLFAYWDIDWTAAFRDGQPSDRKAHLRILHADGSEQSVEVEPMAGSCYVSVERADAAYSGNIGFYEPAATWHSIATSDLISTPPDSLADSDESEFATVPFHLSFQQMLDALRSARREDVPFLAQLVDLRQRAGSADLTASERELSRAVSEAEAAAPTGPGSSKLPSADIWKRQRLERILGFGATSPSGGFGASSRGI